VLAARAFDTGGFEEALACIVALWIVASIVWHELHGRRRPGLIARWRYAVLGMPVLIALVEVRLAIRQ